MLMWAGRVRLDMADNDRLSGYIAFSLSPEYWAFFLRQTPFCYSVFDEGEGFPQAPFRYDMPFL